MPSTMRGAERTLGVLAALNRQNGATVSQLSTATGISRPAMYRVLESLCQQGYVIRHADRDVYELTPLVRSLSDGYKDEDWVRTVAMPIIKDLQEQVVWPTDLATFHGNAMYLRETTRGASPMTIDRVSVGLRLPMLRSATGKAYLAWCPHKERELILGNLRASDHPDDAQAHDEAWVRSLLAGTRRRGYGERQNEIVERTGAVAIPVQHGRRVVACLSITFIASALTRSRRHGATLSSYVPRRPPLRRSEEAGSDNARGLKPRHPDPSARDGFGFRQSARPAHATSCGPGRRSRRQQDRGARYARKAEYLATNLIGTPLRAPTSRPLHPHRYVAFAFFEAYDGGTYAEVLCTNTGCR